MLDTVLHHRKSLKPFVKLGSNPNAIQHMYKGSLNFDVLRCDVIEDYMTCKSAMLDFRIYSFLSSEKPEEDPKPSTWCEKVPKKICAPDFCEMVAGPKECHDKTISSTVVKPEEVCDLQPSTQCRLVTNLVPHLVPQQVCKDIPKEVCHLKLDDPRIIKKPVTLR